MKRPPTSESYFQRELAKRAGRKEYAAPLHGSELPQRLDYLTRSQLDLVNKAYGFAADAHRGQRRRTGHDYITHPLAVVDILADLRVDHETICAALLHDVLEDTSVDKDFLSKLFGPTIANIVDGLTKLSHEKSNPSEQQAQNFYNIALSMARDFRVILVKLADRLHNMRTIGAMTVESRKRIAHETLDFFVPLAGRLGVFVIKRELEQLAFEALHPLRNDRLRRIAATRRKEHHALISSVRESLTAGLAEVDVDSSVEYKEVDLYSIYRSRANHERSINETMNILTFRVIVPSKEDCYRAMGLVHELYTPSYKSVKDYIAVAKINGYQSLHTTVADTHGVAIKFLIRTPQMDEIAKYGFIVGWRNQHDDTSVSTDTNQGEQRQWISNLLALQQDSDAGEFLENVKSDFFPDRIYVYTPQRQIVPLPSGSCVVDFAYAIHTDVGNQCVACRVDGEVVALSTVLESGQTVSIVRSAAAHPIPEWLSFVHTAKARSAIRDQLRTQSKKESIRLGRMLLDRSLGIANTSLQNLDFRRLRRVFSEFSVRRRDELFEQIGRGNLMTYQVAQRLLDIDEADHDSVNIEHGGPIVIQGSNSMGVRYGKCCGPVPGDKVVGHISQSDGMVIHRKACGNVKSIQEEISIVPVKWTDRPKGEFMARVRFEQISSHPGTTASLLEFINSLGAGISTLDVFERTPRLSTVRMNVGVRDLKHLNRVITRLEKDRQDVVNVRRFTD